VKLIGLSIEGLRKIKAAQLDFDGQNLVQIRGENGAGKSTVLDAIRFLLKGTKEIPADVVTHGKGKAEIIGTIDDYVIRRVITPEGKSTLSVEREGGKVAKPQEFLDKISGQFLDPQWFASLSSMDKRNVLIKYLGIDFSEIDQRIGQAEDDRRIAGRELRSVGEVVSVKKVESVDLSDLMRQREEVIRYNSEQDEKGRKLREAEKELRLDLVSVFEGASDSLADDWETARMLFEERMPLIEKLPSPEPYNNDMEEIEEKIRRADEINREAREYERYLEMKKLKEDRQAEYDRLDDLVKQLRQERIDMVNGANVPVKGLEVLDDGLSHNGITDENWSDSESLKIAVMLAGAFSGELKTVYIKRGEAFDSESMSKLKKFADGMDMQIIMEIVDDSYAVDDTGVFYIEEGEITQAKGA
jgi:energy-coupling factor transporter ATP-binding protein EcfA2